MAQNQEIVFEGWLTKSPPTKPSKRIWRAKWRRRWFSLTHSGELPGQFILSYYADRNCRKLKGIINLDQCEQVDVGFKLEGKLKFDYVFDIRTPTRVYYLAADTEKEMKSWVKCICKVCGLKSTTEDEVYDIEVVEEDVCLKNVSETPPVSPVSTNPYIPISECFSGKSPIFDKESFKTLLEQNLKNSKYQYNTTQVNNLTNANNGSQKLSDYVNELEDPRFYDCPRKLTPSVGPNNAQKDNSPLQSPTDTESVFTDEEGGAQHISENGFKNKTSSCSSADLEMVATEKYTKVGVPPRPPKPSHVGTSPNYLNLGTLATVLQKTTNEDKDGENGKGQEAQKTTSDEMYDFPRSHQVDSDPLSTIASQRHCYNNAAPVNVDGHFFRYDISPKPASNQVFRYDADTLQDEPASPHSQGSSTPGYSNLPSPLLTETKLMPPPMVNRDLKPRRKLSDSLSTCSNNEPASPRGAPCVDRKLKPATPSQDTLVRKNFAPEDDVRKVRAAPSPTPPTLTSLHLENQLYNNEHELKKMQYLELDLDSNLGSIPRSGSFTSSIKSQNSSTVYKQVDFMKTQAFNITKSNLEKERQEPISFLKK